MGDLFGIFNDEEKKNDHVDDEGKLLLRQEELDISKDRIKTGEVTIHKEIVEEHKSVDVPLTHEEVIIERRAVDHEPSDDPIGTDEVIHIPVTEETIEVGKHTVITGEISAHKHEVEETETIEETLKREEARVDKDGEPNIVSNDIDNFH